MNDLLNRGVRLEVVSRLLGPRLDGNHREGPSAMRVPVGVRAPSWSRAPPAGRYDVVAPALSGAYSAEIAATASGLRAWRAIRS